MNQDDFDLLESDLFGIQVIKKSSLPRIKQRIGRVIGAYKKVGSKSCFSFQLVTQVDLYDKPPDFVFPMYQL